MITKAFNQKEAYQEQTLKVLLLQGVCNRKELLGDKNLKTFSERCV